MSMSIIKDVSAIAGNQLARLYALDSKEQFPSYDPDAQDKRIGTTFYGDFKVAETFVKAGAEPGALADTWRLAWTEWRNNAAYVTELCVVMNHLCCENADNDELCRWYADKYELCRSRIFSSGSEDEPLPEGCTPFTDDERTQAFNVLD